MKCVSLFSGAGGLDVGAVRAGAEIVVSVECDHDAAETLRLNQSCPETQILERQIQDIDFTLWRTDEDMIVIGGPPCQPFSKNGYWVKNKNRLIEDDPRNMLGQFIRAVRELAPVAFLFENVESILHPTNRETLTRFIDAASRMDYGCTVYRANSADFGVPQKRKRVFVFGILRRESQIPLPEVTHAPIRFLDLFQDIKAHEGVKNFIERFASDKYIEPEEDPSRGTYYYELTHVPPGKNYIALSSLEGYTGRTFKSGTRFWNFLNKLHPLEPSITIAAQPGPWVGPFHWDNRRLRAPEAAAIQTFPDGYQFFGSRRSVQKQIGNAVPCLLAECMVSHLLEQI